MNTKRKTLIASIAIAFAITACNAAQPLASVLASSTNPFAEQSDSLADNIQVASTSGYTYTIVDTGQDHCYDDISSITCPTEGEDFFGQDAQYSGVQASYVDNGDGTVIDLNTGLMWQQTPDLNDKSTFSEAVAGAESFGLAGYDDWRLPTIKELYSLIDFNGSISRSIPYINTDYFDFVFGDVLGGRDIDAQYWSSTEYVSTTMNGSHTVFGVNFADGRIKGYGTSNPRGGQMEQFVRYVRGNTAYGENSFSDNGNGTISDLATGFMWQQTDSGTSLDWEGALNYCSSLDYGGYDDWRLPNAKELQSIVDYSRSPKTTNSAAIDPIFDLTEIESWYWSSTTHLDNGVRNAVYVAFGQAYGLPNGNLIDVHGAGAQRSDPKSGDPSNYSDGRGSPGQDDQVRIYNYARCVREGTYSDVFTGGEVDQTVAFQPGGNLGGQGQTQGQSSQGPGGLNGQSGPPQEAIDACTGSSQGSACSINTPRGTLDGSCTTIQSDLACVPAGGAQGGPGGGPGGQGPPQGAGQP